MVSRETRLALYGELVCQWGRTINLVSQQRISPGWLQRQIDTSLDVVSHLPAGIQSFTDLGSGQGIPAIPIAIATGLAVDLIEADRRKAAFLNTVLARLHLAGRVWSSRIEAAGTPQASCVTAQALAPLPKLIALALPLLRCGGTGLFVKGASAAAEMQVVPDRQDCTMELISLASSSSYLVKVERLR